jgi:hypothetical protein
LSAKFGRPATTRVTALAVGALALGWALFRGIPAWLDHELVPREGWDQAFAEMHERGDDKMLLPDGVDADLPDLQWYE